MMEHVKYDQEKNFLLKLNPFVQEEKIWRVPKAPKAARQNDDRGALQNLREFILGLE